MKNRCYLHESSQTTRAWTLGRHFWHLVACSMWLVARTGQCRWGDPKPREAGGLTWNILKLWGVVQCSSNGVCFLELGTWSSHGMTHRIIDDSICTRRHTYSRWYHSRLTVWRVCPMQFPKVQTCRFTWKSWSEVDLHPPSSIPASFPFPWGYSTDKISRPCRWLGSFSTRAMSDEAQVAKDTKCLGHFFFSSNALIDYCFVFSWGKRFSLVLPFF